VVREICLRAYEKRESPGLGLQVLMGEEFEVMAQNQCRNLQENRIAVVQIIATK
jgi:hypothetical protein